MAGNFSGWALTVVLSLLGNNFSELTAQSLHSFSILITVLNIVGVLTPWIEQVVYWCRNSFQMMRIITAI
ncbi:hypothetical protein [Mesobacillus harenae]|uniref:hypothetical protein n=1 Tax=Mesobacillus harenae TaxID=2213203 RepID=UPI001580EDDF|nr:hypothetical protein [Mesobacillus harenae]